MPMVSRHVTSINRKDERRFDLQMRRCEQPAEIGSIYDLPVAAPADY